MITCHYRLPSLIQAFCLALFLALPSAVNATDDTHLFLDTGGHTSFVHQTIFTQDGRHLISVSDDKSIRVWDVASGKEVGIIYGQVDNGALGKLFCAALRQNGDGTQTLAVAGSTNIGETFEDVTKNTYVIRLYDLGSLPAYDPSDPSAKPLKAKRVRLLGNSVATKGHGDIIRQLEFDPTGHYLASCSADTTIRVWDVSSEGWGDCILLGGRHNFDPDHSYDDEHVNDVWSIAWSPQGDRIASGDADGVIRIWDPKTLDQSDTIGGCHHGTFVQKLDTDHQAVKCLAWSPGDGKELIAGTISEDEHSGNIYSWTRDGGQFHTTRNLVSAEDKPVSCLAISPDGKAIAYGQDRGKGGTYEVRVMSMTPDGKFAKTASFTGHQFPISCVAFPPLSDRTSGETVATGDIAGNVFVWETTNPQHPKRLSGLGEQTNHVAWSSDNKYLKWEAGSEKYVFDFENATCLLASSPSVPPKTEWTAAITDRSSSSISIDPDASYIVDVKTDGRQVSFPPHYKEGDPPSYLDNAVNCMTFTPDGKRVIVGSNFHLTMYDSDTGGQLAEFVGHTAAVQSVAVSPDGKYLASASFDHTIRIWSLQSDDKAIAPLINIFACPYPDDPKELRFVAWDPLYGYYSGSTQGTNIIAWETNQGDEKQASFDYASKIQDLDNRKVITALWETGNLKDAMAQAGAIHDAQFIPPTVSLSEARVGDQSLKDGDAVDSQELEVTAIVTPGSEKLASVVFSVDGYSTVDDLAGVPDEDKSDRDKPIVLKHVLHLYRSKTSAGRRNKVRVTAFDIKQNTSGTAAAETFVCTVPPPPPSLPKLRILAIGIKWYRMFPNLRYPDRDAVGLVDALKQQGEKVFSQVIPTELINKGATKQKIVDAVTALTDTKQWDPSDDDYTIVFVACHSGPTEDNKYYLLPFDVNTTSADLVEHTAIDWNDIYHSLRAVKGHVFLFIDSCHAAGATTTAEQAHNDQEAADNYGGFAQFEDTIDTDTTNGTSPLVVFASCTPGQLSQESPAWRHGAFTKALIDTLTQGNGPATGDNSLVDFRHLIFSVQEKVTAMTDNKQLPTALGNLTNPIYDLPFAGGTVTATTGAAAARTASR